MRSIPTIEPMIQHPPAASAPTPAENKSSIQVIDRLVILLDVLAQHPDSLPLKVLASQAGLHPSTAHRILSAMTAAGFVERVEGGTYRLGIRLLELGALVKERLSLREVAHPWLQQLHRTTGESVNLGIRDGDHIVYIERTSGGRSAVRVVHIVGSRAPLHTTATGKLFLAEEPRAEVERYVARTGLAPMTPRSITDPMRLYEELERVRREALAYDLDEQEVGVRCIAAGIRDEDGTLVAGLSLSTPTERYDPTLAEPIRRTAEAISRALGHGPRTRDPLEAIREKALP
jgi:DNA-binding IclR family transcriptional regulator